ncbi:MAG: hypothetical protein AVDCRST_MAG33-227, partial [uncultured Thermomicrobiales bacterium]
AARQEHRTSWIHPDGSGGAEGPAPPIRERNSHALALPGHRISLRSRLRLVGQRLQGLHPPVVHRPDLRCGRGRHLLPVPGSGGVGRRSGLRHLDGNRRCRHRHPGDRPVQGDAERREGHLDHLGDRWRDRPQGGLGCL